MDDSEKNMVNDNIKNDAEHCTIYDSDKCIRIYNSDMLRDNIVFYEFQNVLI